VSLFKAKPVLAIDNKPLYYFIEDVERERRECEEFIELLELKLVNALEGKSEARKVRD